MNDQARAAVAFLETAGAERVRLEHHGRHPRIVFRWQGADAFYVLPGSPGDSARGRQNTISDLRRRLGIGHSEKQVGERRQRKRRGESAPGIACPALTPLADWREALSAWEGDKRTRSEPVE